MTGRGHAAWIIALLPACFRPSFDRPTCGPKDECPIGWSCSAERVCEASVIDAGTVIDGTPGIDAPPSATETCWKIAATNPRFDATACVMTYVAAIDIQADTQINTTAGTSSPAGLSCATLTGGSSSVCALVAGSIRIRSGVTLSATGNRPLALLAHDLTIEGVVDVASHSAGFLQSQGPAADAPGCRPTSSPTGNGGGAGGTLDGGKDGNNADREGADGGTTEASTGGTSGSSISISSLKGGCPGGANVQGGTGGHGGGAVWIATDTGALVIADSATINASGAGGAGGVGQTLKRGGHGGGSGGMIVLQAKTVMRGGSAKIFANGGGGGGGALDANGTSGTDPTAPGSAASGGQGNSISGRTSGAGGRGYSAAGGATAGGNGNDPQAGGGGGGGGAGVILVASPADISGPNVWPAPIALQ